jgi:hypothetical protein
VDETGNAENPAVFDTGVPIEIEVMSFPGRVVICGTALLAVERPLAVPFVHRARLALAHASGEALEAILDGLLWERGRTSHALG